MINVSDKVKAGLSWTVMGLLGAVGLIGVLFDVDVVGAQGTINPIIELVSAGILLVKNLFFNKAA